MSAALSVGNRKHTHIHTIPQTYSDYYICIKYTVFKIHTHIHIHKQKLAHTCTHEFSYLHKYKGFCDVSDISEMCKYVKLNTCVAFG